MTVNVVIQGFGSMGQEACKALNSRADARVVAVVDVSPSLTGRRVGEISPGTRWDDIAICHPSRWAGSLDSAHVAVHATTAFATEAETQITALLSAGLDVVTICQELVHPIAERAVIAARIDRAARGLGKTVLATGVNPGWALDLLPIAASLGCFEVRAVTGRRVVDFSPYGPDEMTHIGAGLTPGAFEAGVAAGSIGHVGLLESGAMLARALDLRATAWHQTKEPVIASRQHGTGFVEVAPGRVRGFRQRVTGVHEGRTTIDLEMVGLLDPGPDDEERGDTIRVDALPRVDLVVTGLAQDGGVATAGAATNLIGPALSSPPGLVPVWRLPLGRSRTTLELPSELD